MKTLSASIIIILISSFVQASDKSDELYASQRKERHEEKKKWDAADEECQIKFPKGYDSKHPDYDAKFECAEKIQDMKKQFERKQDGKRCAVLGVGCKK